jgi:hypothetical protein
VEEQPPAGGEPIEWVLLTTCAVHTTADAVERVDWYACRWGIEVCQTQPLNMTWCPLRLFRQTMDHLRGSVNRENNIAVNGFSRDHDVAEQALGDGLRCFTRELVKVMAQPLATGLGRGKALVPMAARLPSVRSRPTFRLHLWPCGSEVLPPRVPRMPVKHRDLIGIEPALVWTRAPLRSLGQWRVWRRQR